MVEARVQDPRKNLLERLDKLYTAVVSDILDQLGYREQVAAARIRPLSPQDRLVGFASTVHVEPVSKLPARREDYYKGELAAVEQLQPGDVMMVSTINNCFWGELLSTAAHVRGARGIVLDGYTRDAQSIIDMAFPAFVVGIHCADALGRVDVVDTGSTIEVGDVRVNPEDLVIADYDGVVVIPREVADRVVEDAEDKIRGENLVRTKLAEGMPVSEAFRKYGVL